MFNTRHTGAASGTGSAGGSTWDNTGGALSPYVEHTPVPWIPSPISFIQIIPSIFYPVGIPVGITEINPDRIAEEPEVLRRWIRPVKEDAV